jgi:hypothetical protein
MKKSLLLAAILIAATTAFAQDATTASPAPANGQAVAPQGADKPRQGGHERHGRADAKTMAGRQLAKLDADKDGKVSRQEYLARQSEAFSKTDANADGFVTPEEMAAQHEKRHADMSAKREARKGARPNVPPEAPKPAVAQPPAETK